MEKSEKNKAVNTLKELVRLLSENNVTYSQLASRPNLSPHWNENSLKQFINRIGDARLTDKVLLLYEEIINILSEKEMIKEKMYAEENFLLINRSIRSELKANIESEIDKIYSEINGISSILHLPDFFIFCRYSTNHKYIIMIKIEIIKLKNGYSFLMLLKGSSSNRRVVIGNISSTIANVNFSGVAFNVSGGMTDTDFYNFDFLDFDLRRKFLSENPIGIETITFKNTGLFSTDFPVLFCGLDGKGDPIAGKGLFINSTKCDELSIDPSVQSSITCIEKNNDIVRMLADESFRTIS